jgi:hypothetical protein
MVSNSQVRIVMKRFVFAMVTLTLVGFGMLATTGLARAIIAPIMSPSQSVMQAQAVILGKVTEIEKETVKAEQYPGNPKQDFVIAKVKVNENLYGLEGCQGNSHRHDQAGPTTSTRPSTGAER